MAKGKKTAVKEAKKLKQQSKAHRKETKGLLDDDNLELLIKKYLKPTGSTPVPLLQGKFVECQQPSPRAAISLTALPTGELFLFGGEFYDGGCVKVFNETFRFNVAKKEWRKLEIEGEGSGVVPAPRCSHQTVLYTGCIYLFGGEFATVNQFHHFRDLWRFNLKSNTWEEVTCTGTTPSARSGHRMVVWRNLLVLFGGFHDTARETKYFNDLYVLNFQTFKWTRVSSQQAAGHVCPSPRSGVIMASHSTGILVAGGFCKVKDTERTVEGKMLQDAWWINSQHLLPLCTGKGSGDHIEIPLWEKLGKGAALPTMRSGTSAVTHKSSVICFGGVLDVEQNGQNLSSIYYNDIHSFDLERRRWHKLQLKSATKKRRNKAKSDEQGAGAGETTPSTIPHQESDSESDEDENTFGYYDIDGKLVRIKIEKTISETFSNSQSKSAVQIEEKSDANPKAEEPKNEESGAAPFFAETQAPLPRLNAALAMNGNELLIYGGVVELGRREYTLDDCWSLNLNTRTQWQCILSGHIADHPWRQDQSEEEGDSDGPSNDDEDEETSESSSGMSDDHSETEEAPKFGRAKEEVAYLQAKLESKCELDTPLPNESLAEFFKRSQNYWFEKVEDESLTDVKSIRRRAFDLAMQRFDFASPILKRLATLLEKAQD